MPDIQTLLIVGFVALLVWRLRVVRTNESELLSADTLPDWLEILAVDEVPLVRGKRVARLPSDQYGDGACLMVGLLMPRDPALVQAIRRHCKGVWLDEQRVLARIVATPGTNTSEQLIIGPLDDTAFERTEIQSWLAAHAASDIDVLTELTSNYVGLMETTEQRSAFEAVWQQFRPLP